MKEKQASLKNLFKKDSFFTIRSLYRVSMENAGEKSVHLFGKSDTFSR